MSPKPWESIEGDPMRIKKGDNVFLSVANVFFLLGLLVASLVGCGEKFAGLNTTAGSTSTTSSTSSTSTGAPNLTVTGNKLGTGSVFNNVFVADGGPTTLLDSSNSTNSSSSDAFSNSSTSSTGASTF
jgi:hypothetical protein